jgi:hypothetical protein
MNRDKVESKSKQFKQNNSYVVEQAREGTDRLSILYQKVLLILFRLPTTLILSLQPPVFIDMIVYNLLVVQQSVFGNV